MKKSSGSLLKKSPTIKVGPFKLRLTEDAFGFQVWAYRGKEADFQLEILRHPRISRGAWRGYFRIGGDFMMTGFFRDPIRAAEKLSSVLKTLAKISREARRAKLRT